MGTAFENDHQIDCSKGLSDALESVVVGKAMEFADDWSKNGKQDYLSYEGN